MSHILFVDDDPLITMAYQSALSSNGHKVEVAHDGIAALSAMRTKKPDVVVLDLVMPRLSGEDVVKLMRGQADLASVPVIILSNAYNSGLEVDAAESGVQKGLLKISCTPALLMDAIKEVLGGEKGGLDQSQLLFFSKTPPAKPEQREPALQQGPTSPAERTESPSAPQTEQLRAGFLQSADDIHASLQAALEAFSKSAPGEQRKRRLDDLCRRAHLLAASAGLADCPRLSQLGNAFEALLLRLLDDPSRITASAQQTITAAVDYFKVLFEEAKAGNFGRAVTGEVLVVDDDPASNRLVVWALSRAGLKASSAMHPEAGMKLLEQKQFDLILLDIMMPVMNGFEFCRRALAMPQYAATPVIFVTAHSDFETRAQSILAGGNDLIGKPVMPMELSVKALMLLLKASSAAGGFAAR